MNAFFATTGRALANIVDGTIDVSRKTVAETSNAGQSFAAGWKSQRSMNAGEAPLRRDPRIQPIRA